MREMLKNNDFMDLLNDLSKRFENEPMWIIWIGLRPVIFIQSGATMEPILTSSTYLGKAYDEAKEFFGDGLFISSGQKWRDRRKLLTPAFHIDIIKSFKDSIHHHVMNTVAYIGKQNGASFDIQAKLGESTFANLLETQFGFEGEWTSCISQELRKEYFFALRSLLNNLSCKARSLTCKIPILRHFTTIMATERKYKQTLIKITKTLIATKIEQRFDTSTSALTWIFFQLALDQQVQEKLRKELLDRFKPGMALSLDELNSLIYLECVIKECMRLNSPAPLIGRQDHAFVVPLEDDVPIRLFISGVHKYKKAWGDDADVFDPDRFLDPARDARTKNAFNFIPFSAGPRNCIGQRYANFVIKAFTAQLIMNFRFKTQLTKETVKPCAAVTLFAKNGLFVTAEKLI
ncbi:hypothetical protein Ciccas_009008 [Cichlidogyrus casuarinus]|uniref:Cytochrome P450 n=1 Tax=Cichlidogyrus casuarinus TaxID=1844966 RepID=A0ABD2PYY6_9PLAT